MKFNYLKLVSIVLIISFGCSRENKYYHTFRATDSSVVLTKWRVDFKDRGNTYIIETSDNNNRVKEIRLMDNDTLYNSDCYDVSIIKFEYKKDTIIQYNMVNDSVYSAGIECGEPSKIVYILENNKIKTSISFIDYDIYLKGDFKIEPDFKIQLEKEKIKNKNGINADYNTIWGYQFSSIKNKGFLPVKEDFSFDNYYMQYSESARESPFALQNSKFLHLKDN